MNNYDKTKAGSEINNVEQQQLLLSTTRRRKYLSFFLLLVILQLASWFGSFAFAFSLVFELNRYFTTTHTHSSRRVQA